VRKILKQKTCGEEVQKDFITALKRGIIRDATGNSSIPTMEGKE